ncbi:MAG: hypothetical protein KKI09_03585 [Spirochaetes bacterium]|nr:hypothetical protein [Spirochaetota bacterium]MBU0954489.1 hypothetical protein [Spirochaetota bacterium]
MHKTSWSLIAGLIFILGIVQPLAAQELAPLAPPASPSLSFSIRDDLGLLIEKGSSMARLLVYERIQLAAVLPFQNSILELGLSGSFGSLLGSHRAAGLAGLWQFHTSGSYEPALGFSTELEFGDSIFYGGIAALMPALPMVYFGAILQPLAFRLDTWRWSVLDVSFSLGLSPLWPLRARLGLFSLAYSPSFTTNAGPAGIAASLQGKKEHRMPYSIGLSSAYSLSLSGNYLLTTQGFPSIRLEGRFGPAALSLEAKAIEFIDYQYYSGYQFAGELLLCPASGRWQPAAGFGLVLTAIEPPADWYSAYILGTFGVIRPLRYEFPGSGNVSWTISALEFRIGPLLANPLNNTNSNGNFIAELSLVNLGISFGKVRSDRK